MKFQIQLDDGLEAIITAEGSEFKIAPSPGSKPLDFHDMQYLSALMFYIIGSHIKEEGKTYAELAVEAHNLYKYYHSGLAEGNGNLKAWPIRL